MSRDIIHIKAPGNWINDPNGFIFYKGYYHLFYQYFPYATRWGTMHWGHALSKDLVHWEHKGVALYPTRYEDQNGCFSGSAVEKDGQLYLFYTGIHYNKVDPNDIHKCPRTEFEATQLMIQSEDGFSFDNFHGKQVVVPIITDRKIGDSTNTRDPRVWKGKDAWYMMLGSKTADDRGKLLFYRSEDLADWQLVNTAEKEKGFGWMWECPDYFETHGQGVLLLSAMGILSDGRSEENQSICLLTDFEEETCTMKLPDTYQFLDYGLDLYAPQTTVDEEGRRVMVAWLRMPEDVDGKWCGMFCIPRVVEVKNGHIYFRVHPNVERMYKRQINSATEADPAGYKVSLDMEDGETLNIGGYRIYRVGNWICTDRTEVFRNHEDHRMLFATPELQDGYHLDIYVDDHQIEVFVNDGEYVITNAVYGLKKNIHGNCIDKMQLYTI